MLPSAMSSTSNQRVDGFRLMGINSPGPVTIGLLMSGAICLRFKIACEKRNEYSSIIRAAFVSKGLV